MLRSSNSVFRNPSYRNKYSEIFMVMVLAVGK